MEWEMFVQHEESKCLLLLLQLLEDGEKAHVGWFSNTGSEDKGVGVQRIESYSRM